MSLESILFKTKVAITKEEGDSDISFNIECLKNIPFAIVAKLLQENTVIVSNGFFVRIYEVKPNTHKKMIKIHKKWIENINNNKNKGVI